MEKSVKLFIVYDPPGAASPLRVAETTDGRVIRAAAEAIIADAVTTEADSEDRAYAAYIRQVLSILVPGIRCQTA